MVRPVYVPAGAETVARKPVSLVKRVNSVVNVVAFRVTFTGLPDEGIREMPVMLPAKERRERREVGAGGITLRTRERFPLPVGGGFTPPPPAGPLQEVRANTAATRRNEREKTVRFIGHPTLVGKRISSQRAPRPRLSVN